MVKGNIVLRESGKISFDESVIVDQKIKELFAIL